MWRLTPAQERPRALKNEEPEPIESTGKKESGREPQAHESLLTNLWKFGLHNDLQRL
jgi:hypothetical protein